MVVWIKKKLVNILLKDNSNRYGPIDYNAFHLFTIYMCDVTALSLEMIYVDFLE